MFLSAKSKLFLAFYDFFFFRACFDTKMQIAYVAHKAPAIPNTVSPIYYWLF